MVKPEPDKDEPLLDISKLIHEDFSFEQQLQSTSSLKSGDGEVPYIQKSKSNAPRDNYYFISSPPEEQPPLSKTKTYFFDRRQSREAVNDSSSGVSYFIPLFLLDVIKGSLMFLKPVLSIFLALAVVYSVVKYTIHSVSDSVIDVTCSIPFIRSYIPMCQTTTGIPDFSNFIKAQELLYERMIVQANGPEAISALELKQVELATRDLQVMVKYSNLMSADLFQEKLGDYLMRSRQFGKDIQSLQARTKGVLDNLITYNTFIIQRLDNAKLRKSSIQELRVIYETAMTLVEKEARRLIIAIEAAQMSMIDLEQDLLTIHEISVQEKSYQNTEKPDILADLLNLIQGKGLRRPLVEENLQLLTNFEVQRGKAAHQLMYMLNAMEGFQMDLEELRSHVVVPVVSPDVLSLEVHIENIGKAIERLKQGKVIAWKDRNNNNNNNNNMVINSNNENIISSIP
ncbi:hypothetical protein BDC45DRAFT_575222 [Circinella umbellata]|nr:hypothetical protein BDC45DRAFT_575222 [Circinella umbellata]